MSVKKIWTVTAVAEFAWAAACYVAFGPAEWLLFPIFLGIVFSMLAVIMDD